MIKKTFLSIVSLFIFFFINFLNVNAEIIRNIKVEGNERISDQTIKMFADIQIDQDINEENINLIIKKLYETNFFKDVSISLIDNNLILK